MKIQCLKNTSILFSLFLDGLITTSLTIKAMRGAAQKLIKLVDMNRVGGAVIWNTFTVAQLKDH